MYLVHAVLRHPAAGAALPPDTRELLSALVRPGDRIEHLVLHRDAVPDPVLGLFLLADSLAEAESRAAAFCRTALGSFPELLGWWADRVDVPLVTPFYDRLLAASGTPDRNGPGPFPSTGRPFHPR